MSSMGNWAMFTVYVLLVILWFAVLLITILLPKISRLPLRTKKYRMIHTALIVVAATLLLDSVYWAIANIAHIGVFPRSVEGFLRNPWLMAGVKTLVLVSGVCFVLIVLRVGHALLEEAETLFFHRLINHTWDAIGILDSSGRMKFWNRGAKELFGWEEDDVRGKHIKDFLVPQERHDEIDGILNTIKQTHQPCHNYRTERCTMDQGLISVDITISPIIAHGRFEGYFGIMRHARPCIPLEFYDRPRRYFGPAKVPRHHRFVFVAMPFAPAVVPENVWSVSISEAIRACGMEPVRADKIVLDGAIMRQVFNEICFAAIVVAELTGKNPNSLYELGLAHALDKPVIQLIKKGEDIPFDLMHLRTIIYTPDGLEELKRRLIAAIQECLAKRGSATYY